MRRRDSDCCDHGCGRIHMTPSEQAQFDLFKQKLRGIPGYKIATAMNFLNHGVDFRGCTKEMMAEAWAIRNDERYGHRCIKEMTIEGIIAKIEETYPGGKSHMGAAPDPVKVISKPIKTSRELFEEWATRVREHNDFQQLATRDGYKDLNTDWLWRAWCAGRISY